MTTTPTAAEATRPEAVRLARKAVAEGRATQEQANAGFGQLWALLTRTEEHRRLDALLAEMAAA